MKEYRIKTVYSGSICIDDYYQIRRKFMGVWITQIFIYYTTKSKAQDEIDKRMKGIQ